MCTVSTDIYMNATLLLSELFFEPVYEIRTRNTLADLRIKSVRGIRQTKVKSGSGMYERGAKPSELQLVVVAEKQVISE